MMRYVFVFLFIVSCPCQDIFSLNVGTKKINIPISNKWGYIANFKVASSKLDYIKQLGIYYKAIYLEKIQEPLLIEKIKSGYLVKDGNSVFHKIDINKNFYTVHLGNKFIFDLKKSSREIFIPQNFRTEESELKLKLINILFSSDEVFYIHNSLKKVFCKVFLIKNFKKSLISKKLKTEHEKTKNKKSNILVRKIIQSRVGDWDILSISCITFSKWSTLFVTLNVASYSCNEDEQTCVIVSLGENISQLLGRVKFEVRSTDQVE